MEDNREEDNETKEEMKTELGIVKFRIATNNIFAIFMIVRRLKNFAGF